MQAIMKYFSEIGAGQTAYLLISVAVAAFLITVIVQYRSKRGCYCFDCFKEDAGWVIFLTLSWFVLLVIALLTSLLVSKDYLAYRMSRKEQHA